MPLYEYQCEACGHRFEVIQKFSDAPVETCPKCRGAVRKLIAAPAFQLKGTGWYVTDFAKKGTPAAPAEKSGDAATETGGTAATDKGATADKGKSGDGATAPASAAPAASSTPAAASKPADSKS